MGENEIETGVPGLTGFEIAVIGMSGRFPGADNIEEFWENLKNGRETISFFSAEEVKESGVPDRLLTNPNYVRAYGWMDGVSYFDAAFFGYTPLEAEIMDPQLRVFHECAYGALEDAGYDPSAYKKLIGIYAGASASFDWQAKVELSRKNKILGWFAAKQLTDKDFLGTRIAYRLSLKGPAVTVDTACSTSLTAIHLACQGLIAGDCDMALAGGVTVPLFNPGGYVYKEGMIMASDGHCRAFDARADGSNFGNAAAVVVLKRYTDAAAEGDNLYALIKGSAINNDGDRKAAYTAPSIDGQSGVIRRALHMAEVDPETITYVETHGTGTTLGDPVEIEGLKEAFNTPKKHFCRIGSVKTNVGHLEMASGVTGFIKTVLALKHRQIPPSLFFETPNPKIDFANSPFVVNTQLTEWKRNTPGQPLRAGVSSFGIGGTNAHAILEEAPPIGHSSSVIGENRKEREYQLILLSAKTEPALEQMTQNLAEYIKKEPGINLADAAYTLQVGRRVFPYRRMLVCPGSDTREAVDSLKTDTRKRKTYISKEDNRPIVFMFPGLGEQYVNMGRDLYQKESIFRAEMDRCFEILKPLLGLDIKEIIYPSDMSGRSDILFDQPEISQVVVFILEYALARLIMKWGIKPDSMIGYSLGEYAAACLAGVFSLEDALKVMVVRGELIKGLPRGGMLSVPLPREQLEPLVQEFAPALSIAIDNGPSGIVSGIEEAVDRFAEKMKEKKLLCLRIKATHGLHSPAMNPILKEFERALAGVALKAPQIPYISNVTGQWIKAEEAIDPAYWARHLIRMVRFADGMKELLKKQNALLLEIGPGRDLRTLALRYMEGEPGQRVINLVRHPQQQIDDDHFLLNRIGGLWLYGQTIDWRKFYHDEKRQRITLPTYPFEGRRYWIDDIHGKDAKERVSAKFSTRPGQDPDPADCIYLPSWKRLMPFNNIPAKLTACLHWLVFPDDCDLGTLLIEKLLSENQSVSVVKRGTEFGKVENPIVTYTVNPGEDDHYDLLFKELRSSGQFPTRIVHLWGVTAGTAGVIDRERVVISRESGYYSLLNIARAIGNQGISGEIRLSVITNNMQAVTGKDNLYPEKSVVLGPVKIIPTEYLNIKSRSIDVDVVFPSPGPGTGGSSKQKVLRQLWRELAAGSEPHEPVVAYRGDYCWVPLYETLQRGSRTPGQTLLKPAGVYLITGGLGGIGLALAEYLAKEFRAKLVLTGRTSLPPRDQWKRWLMEPEGDEKLRKKIEKIEGLEKLGAEVMAASADVCNPGQMQEVIARAEERFGSIDGILHCAGLPDGEMIQRRTRETSLRIFGPKVEGTLVLDSLLPLMKKKPGFFLLCSSTASILPMFGQVGYCAANAFLDAFAHYKNTYDTDNDEMFTLSIDWDRWKGVGVANILETRHKQLTGQEMEGGLTREKALEIFRLILAGKPTQAVASPQDIMALIERGPAVYSTFLVKGLEKLPASRDVKKRPSLDNEYVPPGNEVQEMLVNLWGEFFGYEKIGIQDDFFELGGDSLKALVLLPKIHKQLEVEVHIAHFFNHPTIEKLSRFIVGAEKHSYRSIVAVEKKEFYALSSGQKRLYILQQMQKNSIAYNESQAVLQDSDPGKESLEGVFKTLIRKHENLRTSFEMIGGNPVQRVHDEVEFEIEYYDLTKSPVEENGEKEEGRNRSAGLIKNFLRPFDLSEAPLLRVGLIKESPQKYILVVDLHHIITDGTSNRIFLKEFTRLRQGNELDRLKIQYKDYAEWYNSESQRLRRRDQEVYWLKALAGELPLLHMPADYPRPGEQSYEGKNLSFAIGKEETRGLRNLPAAEGITLYMKLLAVYYVFLSKLTGQEDIVIGSPTAGRRHSDLEHIMGMFVNTLPLRNYPRDDKTFLQFLQEVKENSLSGFENQECAFEDLLDKLDIPRDVSRNPVFDVFFDLQNRERIDESAPRVFMSYDYQFGLAKFDLSLYAVEYSEEIGIRIEYSVKLFKDETIKRFVSYFKKLVSSIISNPHMRLWEIDIISEEEKNRLLFDFNNTGAEYTRDKTIYRLVEEQVARTPDYIAAVGVTNKKAGSRTPKPKDMSLTYGELKQQVDQMTARLREKGLLPGIIVGIKMDRSIELLIGLLGILKGGGAYLPIDPEFPAERIDYMLKDSSTKIVVLNGGDIRAEGFPLSMHTRFLPVPGNDLAYVIYTSGSTGKPKGTAIGHRQAVNFIKGMTSVIDFPAGKSILGLTTISFDIFFLETLLPVACGLKVVIAGESCQKNPTLLQEFIGIHKVDIMQVTPSRLKLFLDFIGSGVLSDIRELLVGGEAFTPVLFKRLQEVYRGKIYNVYGPTETTIWSTFKDLSTCRPRELNIGRPIINTRVYIVNRHHRVQPIGVIGELSIGGEGVAAGYLNNPELTGEKFIIHHSPFTTHHTPLYRTGDLARWSANGEIEFLGRLDHQVKIRGYRIELEEIETHLLKHENIKEAVVTAGTNKTGDKYLCAYLVPKKALSAAPPYGIDVAALRKMLTAKLPDYMVPSYFVPLEDIPLTANGKSDIKALPKPEEALVAVGSYLAPATSNEKKLAEIWKEILQIEKIGIYDNFFTLGGNSLNVLRLNQRLLETFGKDIPLTEMFRNLTIRFLDQYLHEDSISRVEKRQKEEMIQTEAFEEARKIFKDTMDKFRE